LWFVPHLGAVLAGALPGAAITVFSIVNYSLEQFSLRRLTRTGLSVLRSLLMVSLISVIPVLIVLLVPRSDAFIELLKQVGLIEIDGDMISIPHGWPVMIMSLFGGVVVGSLLGTVIGLTLIRTSDDDREEADVRTTSQ